MRLKFVDLFKMKKIEIVIQKIEQMIESGTLAPGARLPSVRQTASEIGASKNTIVEAYARLSARQIIRSQPGAGYFVIEQSEEPNIHANSVLEASDRVSLLHAQLSQDYIVRPGDGRPPPSWMKEALPKRIDSSFITSGDNDHTGYGNPMGHLALREIIAKRFNFRGPTVSPSQVSTTFGANHALDLLIRRYLSPGQCVLVDDPGYYPLFAKLRLAQVKAIAVPRGKSGPDLQKLEELAIKHSPTFFFTQSSAHNPTGTSYDLRTSHAALQIAAKYNFRIVDDDPFVDLPGLNSIGSRLWELDGFQSVIFVGSFSKLLSASFRSGYIVADKKIIDDINEFKMITTVNSSRLSEVMIAQMIRNGRYDKHLNRLERRLTNAREVCEDAFRNIGLQMYTQKPEGFYTLLDLPKNADIDKLKDAASKQKIFLALGQFFSPNSNAQTTSIRINFTRSADQRFFTFLKKYVAQ